MTRSRSWASCTSTSELPSDREIELTRDLAEFEKHRLLEIAERCPIHRTLKSETNIRPSLIKCRVPEEVLASKEGRRPARKARGGRRRGVFDRRATPGSPPRVVCVVGWNAAGRDASPAECNKTSGTRH